MRESHKFPKEQVRSAISEGIMRAKKQERTSLFGKGKKMRNVMYGLCSLVATIVILIGSSYFSPSLASSLSQIPIIGSVFSNSDSIGLQKAQKQALTSQIGETQTIDGISVTLDEILYDQNNITIGLVIESEEELEEFYFGAGMDFKINGKYPTSTSGSYGETVTSETTRTAIQTINVTEELPDKFDLDLMLYGKVGETWHFSAPIQKITDITKVAVNHSQVVDGVELKVPELSISETGISINYTSFENETDFELSRGGNIEFLVVDQDGNEVTSYSGGATGERVKDKIVFKSNKHFDPIDSTVTELTITPYLVIPTSGGRVQVDADGTEVELEYKGDSIKPIEFESFKVRIK